MNSMAVLLVLSTVLLVLAIVVAAVPLDDQHSEARSGPAKLTGARAARAAWTAGFGVTVLAVSGWVVPAIIIAAATWYWVGAYQQRDSRRANDVERTDALASWIENLRDVLLAGDQPIGAIASSVSATPPIIRPAVRRLSAALGHQDPDTAFRRFAEEIDDPLGDLVAAGLLMAVRRGARTVTVLTSLAAQARAAANRRRIVDAERAPIRPRGPAALADHGSAGHAAARVRPLDVPGCLRHQ